MIQDLALRWVVTVLFGLSVAQCLFAIATEQRRWTSVVAQLLHTVMAVAMVAMAWPWGANLPTTAQMVFFLLAAAWFAAIAVGRAGAGRRIGTGYHALMMLAMAWMYAVMSGDLLRGQSTASALTHAGHAGHAGHSGSDMPGMDPSGMGGTGGGGNPAWITTINWVCALGFAIAAVFWLYRYLYLRQSRSPETPGHHLGILCQAMMAAGVAIMFGDAL